MARWAIDGSLDLDAMVTREIALTDDDLAEAIRAMLAGEVIRSVVVFPGVDDARARRPGSIRECVDAR